MQSLPASAFDPVAAKRRLRTAMRMVRGAAWRPWLGPQAAAILFDELLPRLRPRLRDGGTGCRVAGYWPMTGEADPLPALHCLSARDHACLLPAVEGIDRPGGIVAGQIRFRDWPIGVGRPPPGAFGIPEPPPQRRSVDPDLVLVPLLAVDPSGRRLGQGAGFYDRALARLRARQGNAVVAIGWALDCQVLRVVPATGHDAPLDWIVTESRVIRCGTDWRHQDQDRDQDQDDAGTLSR